MIDQRPVRARGAVRTAKRCAVHPSRPAIDRCPNCGRGRCAADGLAPDTTAPEDCAVCRPPLADQRAGRQVLLERAIRAGLATYTAALLGGWIATQYVQDHVFSIVVPLIVGGACAAAADTAWGVAWGALSRLTATVIAAVGAVIAIGLSNGFVPGGASPFHPVAQVGPPYLAALTGVLAWRVLFAARPLRPG